jgi:hypothetical protein
MTPTHVGDPLGIYRNVGVGDAESSTRGSNRECGRARLSRKGDAHSQSAQSSGVADFANAGIFASGPTTSSFCKI